jgi:hypothetical protein
VELSRLMDPARSRAELIGAGRYGPAAGVADLPTVAAGVNAFARILTDPKRGGLDPSACCVVLDPESEDVVDRAIVEKANEAEDTLLVYYGGHGVPDLDEGSLYLAVRRTELAWLRPTAVPYRWVRQAIRASNARTKVIILDCCYSGIATTTTMSDGELAAQADVDGTFVLTATARNVLALAPPGEDTRHSRGALIEVLMDGVEDESELLDLETVFRVAKRKLIARARPEPQALRLNDASRLALARNPAHRQGLPRHVRTLISSRDASDRQAALTRLSGMLHDTREENAERRAQAENAIMSRGTRSDVVLMDAVPEDFTGSLLAP